jgi:hypothetical protein
MKKSELKELILECNRELTEEEDSAQMIADKKELAEYKDALKQAKAGNGDEDEIQYLTDMVADYQEKVDGGLQLEANSAQKEIAIDEVETDYETLRKIADKYRAAHVIKGSHEGVENDIVQKIQDAAEDLWSFIEEYEEEK